MVSTAPIFDTPAAYLAATKPDAPVHFFAPARLAAKAAEFQRKFPGQVTFAVKANPSPAVLAHLLGAGISGFDVASPA